MTETLNRELLESKKDDESEMERCKDPVYFYNNYWLVNGQKPTPITKEDWSAKMEGYDALRNSRRFRRMAYPILPDEAFLP